MNLDCQLSAFDDCDRNSITFPLTRALSLGEREKLYRVTVNSKICDFIQSFL
jgi:hypothetical protein